MPPNIRPDAIAAVDEEGRFCNSQLLIPLLIDHLARARQLLGCVVKTVSGSDLMSYIAKELGLEVIELPVGFKYITAEMLPLELDGINSNCRTKEGNYFSTEKI